MLLLKIRLGSHRTHIVQIGSSDTTIRLKDVGLGQEYPQLGPIDSQQHGNTQLHPHPHQQLQKHHHQLPSRTFSQWHHLCYAGIVYPGQIVSIKSLEIGLGMYLEIPLCERSYLNELNVNWCS